MSNMEYESENRINDDEIEIDILEFIKDYFKILSKLWLPVLILIIICASLFAGIKYKRYTPSYKASATYSVNIMDGTSSKVRFYNNTTAQQMAKTFPHILTSGLLQRKVAADMKMDSVPGGISATVEENTNFLTISVTAGKPDLAYNILQSVVKVYPSVSEIIMGKVNMDILDESGVPTEPYNKLNLKVTALKGAAVALFLGLLWAFLLVFTRRTIRTKEQCVKYINLKCLGVVPYQFRKSRSKNIKRELNILDKEVTEDFGEAFRIIRNKVEYSAKHHGLKVILVTSALAGEGKSTISSNLAIVLAMDGKKVSLIDCDFKHPSVAKTIGFETKKGLSDYIDGKATLKEVMVKGKDLFKYKLPLYVIPGGKPTNENTSYTCSKKLMELIYNMKQNMDYVIVDTPPAGIMSDAGLLANYCDGAVYVVKNDFARVDHIIEGLESMKKSDIHMIGCVINGDR